MIGTNIAETIDTVLSEDTRSLSDQVYDYLSKKILQGEFAYNEKLNIKKIAAQLNVSSMPIRDAMKRLEIEGIVIVKPRSNCYIPMPTKHQAMNAVDTRRMLEMFAVSSIYKTPHHDVLHDLDIILDEMRVIAEIHPDKHDDDAVREYIELDRRFHTSLCGMAENEYINRFFREINMHLGMSFSYGCGVCHGVSSTYEEHQTIVKHLYECSADVITDIESHLLKSRYNILQEAAFLSLPDRKN